MKEFTVTMLLLLSAMMSFAQELPVDSEVKTGRLENGLTYYIRHNSFSKGKADLYVVYRIGAILEEDNEDGMAHFLEHMAYNGSANFPGNKAQEFIDATGTIWNANTGLERTLYFFNNISLEKEGVFDKCLLLAYDWSGNLTLDKNAMEKEKSIINEERRMRGGADARIMQAFKAELIPASKYVKRSIIGKEETTMNFTPELLRHFYKKWYTPDKEAIIVVGDIDPDVVEKKIKEMFGPIPAPAVKLALPDLKISDGKGGTLVAVVKDKEIAAPIFNIEFRHEPLTREENGSVDAFSQNYLITAVSAMMNERLESIIAETSGQLNGTSVDYSSFLGTEEEESLQVSLGIGNNKTEESIKQFLSEVIRIRQHGFTSAEYERAKLTIAAQYKKALEEKDNTNNPDYVDKYVNHFLTGKYIPGVEIEYKVLLQLMPQVSLDVINEYVRELMPEENIVLYLALPEGGEVLQKKQLVDWYTELNSRKFEPYVNKTDNEPLLAAMPTPGSILSKSADSKLGTVIYNLSNGARVVVKQTDFKNNEIAFSATSPGGSSLFPEQNMGNVKLYEAVAGLGGVGNFSNMELQKKLAGKNIDLIPMINVLGEGLKGSTDTGNMETFLQLVYLQFTSPRMDPDAFKGLIEEKKREIRSNDPWTVFSQKIKEIAYKGAVRMMPLTMEELQKADYQQIVDWRKNRYSDASDFTFVFSGNIDPDSFEALIKQYLASLPAKSRKESAAKVNVSVRQGRIKENFQQQMETPQAWVANIYSAKSELSLKNRIIMAALVDVLNASLNETIRLQEGGTYTVGVFGSINEYPKGETVLHVLFSTQPGKEEHLNTLAKQVVNNMALNGPATEKLENAISHLKNKQEENLKDNRYWASSIAAYYAVDLDNVSGYQEILDSITEKDIQLMATKLVKDNLIEIIMKSK